MVRAIPFGKLQETWSAIWGDAIYNFLSALLSLSSWFRTISSPVMSNLIV